MRLLISEENITGGVEQSQTMSGTEEIIYIKKLVNNNAIIIAGWSHG
jgi:hypothetical protein